MSHINDLMNRTLNGEGNSDQHVMAIFSIVLQIKAQNILELGVYEGNTSVPLAFGASLTGGKLTSVDNFVRPQNFPSDLEDYRTLIQKDSIKFGDIVYAKESFNIDNISDLRVNVIGYTNRNTKNESGITIHKKDILKRFSIDKDGDLFRIEFYKDKNFAGMILLGFEK